MDSLTSTDLRAVGYTAPVVAAGVDDNPPWLATAFVPGPSGVTAAGGRIYYSTDLAVQALDAKTGAPVWAFTPSGTASGTATFLSTPAVASGMVFVGCGDDSLYAFQA